jgi:hypothetical protein
MHARDVGTLGDIELNPQWARMGNSTLAAGSDLASAFFKSGSGRAIGSAAVDFTTTDVSLSGVGINVYTISVPWKALRGSWDNYSFDVSWRPDCGNDIINGSFVAGRGPSPKPMSLAPVWQAGPSPESVPEPSSMLALLIGSAGLTAVMRRKR